MKKWNAPEIEELDVKLTASGGDASNEEANGGFISGVWTNAKYDAVNYEKCDNGQMVAKKASTES